MARRAGPGRTQLGRLMACTGSGAATFRVGGPEREQGEGSGAMNGEMKEGKSGRHGKARKGERKRGQSKMAPGGGGGTAPTYERKAYPLPPAPRVYTHKLI